MSYNYYVGAIIRLKAGFTDLNGNPANPTSTNLLVMDPDSIEQTHTGVYDALGSYHYDLLITKVGTWLYEWSGTGTLTAVQPGEFVAYPFPPFGWSYSGNPKSSAKDEIRFLIADTDKSKPWTLQDAEIQYVIGQYSQNPPTIGTNLLTAAICAETILAKLKALPTSKKVGDLSLSYDYKFFESVAYRLRQRATLQGCLLYTSPSPRD